MNEEMRSFEKKITELSQKYGNKIREDKIISKFSGNKFNIFNIIGIATREVYMCRIFAELLDPQGCHSQGTQYLNLFIELLSEKSGSNCLKNIKTENVIIQKEDPTKYVDNHENRRIDITINEKNGVYIPIEVKINACEQDNQCSDYLRQVEGCYEKQERHKQPDEAIMFFLTKTGYKPQNINPPEDIDKIFCISWKDDILCWIKECIDVTPRTATPIAEILIQFKEAIEEFVGQRKEHKVMSDEIDNLCKNIYIENKDAFDKLKEWECSTLPKQTKTILNELLSEMETNGKLFLFGNDTYRMFVNKKYKEYGKRAPDGVYLQINTTNWQLPIELIVGINVEKNNEKIENRVKDMKKSKDFYHKEITKLIEIEKYCNCKGSNDALKSTIEEKLNNYLKDIESLLEQ